MPVNKLNQYEWRPSNEDTFTGGEMGCEPLDDGSGMVFTLGVDYMYQETNGSGQMSDARAWEDFKMDWEEARALRDYLNKVVK